MSWNNGQHIITIIILSAIGKFILFHGDFEFYYGLLINPLKFVALLAVAIKFVCSQICYFNYNTPSTDTCAL